MKLWKIPMWWQIGIMCSCIFLLFTNSFDFVCNNEAKEDLSDGKVMYEIAAEIFWDQSTHPQNFPTGAGFCPFVFVTHKEDATFWEEGNFVSPGLQLYIETGDFNQLENELLTMKANREIFDYYISSPLYDISGDIEMVVESSFEFDHYSMVMRIEPSPDWFLGINNLPFKRYNDIDDNYTWRVHQSAGLFPMDGGTDAGVDFNSADVDEIPIQPVKKFTPPFAYPFLDSTGTKVMSLGRFIIRKI